MEKKDVKIKVLAYGDWEPWLERPFGPFMISTWAHGQSKDFMKTLGIPMGWPAVLYQNQRFYRSEKVWQKFSSAIKQYLNKGGRVQSIVKSCEAYYKSDKKKFLKLLESDSPVLERLQGFYEIITKYGGYIWIAHGFDLLYESELRSKASKYVPLEDLDKFIGDITFPNKKNKHFFFEEALRGKESLEKIKQQYAWIKCRDGFSSGFTIKELRKEREQLKSTNW